MTLRSLYRAHVSMALLVACALIAGHPQPSWFFPLSHPVPPLLFPNLPQSSQASPLYPNIVWKADIFFYVWMSTAEHTHATPWPKGGVGIPNPDVELDKIQHVVVLLVTYVLLVVVITSGVCLGLDNLHF